MSKLTDAEIARMHPETLALSYGFDPWLSEGSIKPPVFLTSTFAFKHAADGKQFFAWAHGEGTPPPRREMGLIYSRINNPNLEILEDRLALWEGMQDAYSFSSGMAAIATTCFALLRPGDSVLHSRPLYGGTETLLKNQMGAFGVAAVGFTDGVDAARMQAAAKEAAAKGRVAMIMVETPANPTNGLVDLAACAAIADALGKSQGHRPPVVVDNTLLGPLFQKPLKQGADISLLSLTKYVGGHSDLVAGGVIGRAKDLAAIKKIRSAFGMQLDPHSSWMLGRSLETLHLRMERASQSASKIARWLKAHPKVAEVHHPELIQRGNYQAVYAKTCKAGGSTFAFTFKEAGEAGAFRFLNDLHLFTLAVSLGGTESLISHPASTTHSGVAKEIRDSVGVTDGLVRISVGLENPDDLIADLAEAMEKV